MSRQNGAPDTVVKTAASRARILLMVSLVGFGAAAFSAYIWIVQRPVGLGSSVITGEQVDSVSESPLYSRKKKEEKIELTITGIVDTSPASDPGSSGYALVLKGDEQKEVSYAVGTEILSGVVLHAVARDHIVVRREGILQQLPLKHRVMITTNINETAGDSLLHQSSLGDYRSKSGTNNLDRHSLTEYRANKNATDANHRRSLVEHQASTGNAYGSLLAPLVDYRRNQTAVTSTRSLADYRTNTPLTRTALRPLSDYVSDGSANSR